MVHSHCPPVAYSHQACSRRPESRCIPSNQTAFRAFTSLPGSLCTVGIFIDILRRFVPCEFRSHKIRHRPPTMLAWVCYVRRDATHHFRSNRLSRPDSRESPIKDATSCLIANTFVKGDVESARSSRAVQEVSFGRSPVSNTYGRLSERRQESDLKDAAQVGPAQLTAEHGPKESS